MANGRQDAGARTRVVGYARVSTEDQAREGVSLAAQRAKLEAYATALDLELVAVREDAGVSAKTLDRPGLRAALEDLRAGRADALLVPKLDRLTRSVRDLGTTPAQLARGQEEVRAWFIGFNLTRKFF